MSYITTTETKWRNVQQRNVIKGLAMERFVVYSLEKAKMIRNGQEKDLETIISILKNNQSFLVKRKVWINDIEYNPYSLLKNNNNFVKLTVTEKTKVPKDYTIKEKTFKGWKCNFCQRLWTQEYLEQYKTIFKIEALKEGEKNADQKDKELFWSPCKFHNSYATKFYEKEQVKKTKMINGFINKEIKIESPDTIIYWLLKNKYIRNYKKFSEKKILDTWRILNNGNIIIYECKNKEKTSLHPSDLYQTLIYIQIILDNNISFRKADIILNGSIGINSQSYFDDLIMRGYNIEIVPIKRWLNFYAENNGEALIKIICNKCAKNKKTAFEYKFDKEIPEEVSIEKGLWYDDAT